MVSEGLLPSLHEKLLPAIVTDGMINNIIAIMYGKYGFQMLDFFSVIVK